MILAKDTITLPLAIEDYLPVILFAVGLYFIAKMIYERNEICGKLAFLGGFLITLGGFFKASWKLVQALGGADIPFLNNSLFVLLSSGFILLAWALWKSRKSKSGNVWLVPIILIVVSLGIASYFGFVKESRAWFFILLGITSLANLILLLQLIFRSYQNKLWLAIALYFVNLIVIFALSASADQSVTFQWIKQGITTISQACFAFASYLLYQKTRQNLA